MFLEVSDQGKKWSFEVTGKTYLKLSLDTLEKYKWKLIIGSDSLSTPKKAFEISAPAPMPAISGEELIFKDSK
jgi:hypothetical protein